MEFIKLDKLNVDVKKKLKPYCNSILTKPTDDVKSIVVYRNASSGE